MRVVRSTPLEPEGLPMLMPDDVDLDRFADDGGPPGPERDGRTTGGGGDWRGASLSEEALLAAEGDSGFHLPLPAPQPGEILDAVDALETSPLAGDPMTIGEEARSFEDVQRDRQFWAYWRHRRRAVPGTPRTIEQEGGA